MAFQIDPLGGILSNGSAQTVDLQQLGWNLKTNVQYFVSFPCTAGGYPLLADAVLLDDNGYALAVILSGISLDDDTALRVIADVYSNSAKRHYGQRPAVFFVGEKECKAAYGLLGKLQTNPPLVPKDTLIEQIAVQNIQEEVLFHLLLDTPELAKQFLSGTLPTEKINQILEEALEKAKDTGYSAYYHHTLCPTDSTKKQLPKQALLLGGLGEKEYLALCQKQSRVVQKALYFKSAAIFQEGIEKDTWLPIPQPSNLESRQLDWAFTYHGWNREKDLIKNSSVPCYLDESMQLLTDYAFLDPNGKPILLFLRDTLNLSKEKAFLVAEVYARSYKATFGIVPFVVLAGKNGTMLKMGALSGGFEPLKQIIPRIPLAVQVAAVNVSEHRAWETLLTKTDALQAIPNGKDRLTAQISLIQKSAEDTKNRIQDQSFLKAEFDKIQKDNRLLEEEFWKKMDGETNYQKNRRKELSFLRTFAADKRIAAGITD